MAKYDLTKLHCQFLDRHLTFPLFEFLCEKQLYNPNEILKCILDTVNKTNMIDYIMDTRKRLGFNGDMPKELVKRKRAVLDTLRSLKNELSPIMNAMEILKDGENIKDIKSFIKILENEHNFNMDDLDCCYSLAKYLYECGNYQESISYLYFCSIVMSPDHKNYLNVLWGKLAAEILLLNWNTALDDLMRLRDYIDAANFNDLQFLQQRTWLIHWSVLIFFNHSRGRELFIDMFLYEPYYINAIQTMCPHILRYLATAVIVECDRRDALKDLIRIIKQESYAYRDPITEFIECLYVNFDFEMARFKLHECQTLILSDFFIEDCLNKFIENARLMFFEAFCRTHQCVSIKMMAEKLNMEPQATECWIVKLIQSARLNATIDSKLGHVVMGVQRLSPYQQMVDKLESLAQRSEQLTKLVERCSEQKKRNPGESWKYYPSQ